MSDVSPGRTFYAESSFVSVVDCSHEGAIVIRAESQILSLPAYRRIEAVAVTLDKFIIVCIIASEERIPRKHWNVYCCQIDRIDFL
jgi:hypothetical protein